MDSAEDDNSLQCDSPDEFEAPKRTFVDAEVQLDLSNDCRAAEDLESAFQNEDLKLPLTLQNCIPSNLQVSSELVVITNSSNGFLNPSGNGDPLPKRLCIEQDGQTYILALQDSLDGFSNVIEIPPKTFASIDPSQLLNYTDANTPLSVKDGINQNWFTSKEEKVELHSKGHVWKTGMWSKEEVELLENNISLYCKQHEISNPASVVFEMAKDERKDFYRTIAKGLNRPLFSVYRRVIRMYDIQNHVGKYTPQELDKLKELRSIYGNDWQAIGTAMGRSASSIKDRCRLLKEHCNQGKWLQAEEQRLADAVYELGHALPGEMISSGLSWAVVADRVGTRSEKQCRSKWLNYLNWKVAGGTVWTQEDDITLICRVFGLNATDENEVDWKQVSENWLSVRSPQWLRGKWWNLKKHVPNVNDISFQEICEFLYNHFVLKMKVKNEAMGFSDSPLDLHSLLNGEKPTILQSMTLPPQQTPIVVTAAAQVLPSPIVTLTNAPGVVSSPVAPVLQTVEVLPPNIHLTANPQTFVITTSNQQTLPITTSLPTNQIILQTMTADALQRHATHIDENGTAHVVIDDSCNARLTSLASTQIPSAPPSPIHSSHLLVESYGTQTLDAHVSEDGTHHLILADPMLAANRCTEMGNSDTEFEKNAQDRIINN